MAGEMFSSQTDPVGVLLRAESAAAPPKERTGGTAFFTSLRHSLAPWGQALHAVIGPFALARFLYALWGAILAITAGVRDDYGNVLQAAWPPAPPWGPWLEQVFLLPWRHYDVWHYLSVATDGYAKNPHAAIFYPLHPLLIRAATAVVGHPLGAAMLLNLFIHLLLVLFLYRLVEAEFGPQKGRWTIIALLSFPLALSLFIPYSEALFILATVAAFGAAYRRQWWLAGLAGAAAAVTRQPGLFLLPALGLEWLLWVLQERRRKAWLSGLWLGLVPLPALGFNLYLGAQGIANVLLANPLSILQTTIETERLYWHSAFLWPWQTVALVGRNIAQGQGGLFPIDLFWAVVVSGSVVAAVWVWRRPGLVVYGLLTLFAAWAKVVGPPSTSPIESLARRLIVFFPLYLLIGHLLERHRLLRPVWWVLAGGLFLLQGALLVRNVWIP